MAAVDAEAPRMRKVSSSNQEIEERLERIERRQAEIVDVLAGVSQAGRWLKQQIEDGEL